MSTDSEEVQSDAFDYDREEIEKRLIKVVNHVYRSKKITRAGVKKIVGSDKQAGIVLNALREHEILQLEGQRKAAKWLMSDKWVTHDHEVVGA